MSNNEGDFSSCKVRHPVLPGIEPATFGCSGQRANHYTINPRARYTNTSFASTTQIGTWLGQHTVPVQLPPSTIVLNKVFTYLLTFSSTSHASTGATTVTALHV
jgi:hypothetical protein